jgi:cytochrome o ubiquinol oxidase subunit I
VWWIWWLAIASALAMWATMIWRSSDDETDFILAAAEVERIEVTRLRSLERLKTAGRT